MEYVCIADSVGLKGTPASCSNSHRMLTDPARHRCISRGLHRSAVQPDTHLPGVVATA